MVVVFFYIKLLPLLDVGRRHCGGYQSVAAAVVKQVIIPWPTKRHPSTVRPVQWKVEAGAIYYNT